MAKKQSAFSQFLSDVRNREGYKSKLLRARFAEQLNELIVDAGMSRAEFAETVGCSKPYITKVLRGESNVTLDTMVKFSHSLGLIPRVEFVPDRHFWAKAFYVYSGMNRKKKKPVVNFKQLDMQPVATAPCRPPAGELVEHVA